MADQIDLRTPEGLLDCHVFRRQGSAADPAVILYMDALGIRPALASMAERLAGLGYIVAVPNLYYRSGAYEPFDSSKVFVDGPERDRFKGMIASISDAAVMRDTAVVIQALDRFSGVRPGAMGAVGYCMGGGFAVSAAGTFPDRVAVATSFHGGGLAVDRRDSPHLLASRIKARIYIGAAGVDPSFTDDQQHRLEKSLDEAGVNYTLERYPDARHGFAVTAHPAYDRVASERHWSVLAEELQAALSPQT